MKHDAFSVIKDTHRHVISLQSEIVWRRKQMRETHGDLQPKKKNVFNKIYLDFLSHSRYFFCGYFLQQPCSMKNFLCRQINYDEVKKENSSFSWWIMMARIFYKIFFGVVEFWGGQCIFINLSEHLRLHPAVKTFTFHRNTFFCPSFFLHNKLKWNPRADKSYIPLLIESDCNQLSKQMEKSHLF